MSDEQPTEMVTEQATETEATQQPSQANPQDTPQPVVMTTDDVQAELEKVRAALKAANKEAAERRVKLQEYEEQERKRKEAEMSEIERAMAKAEEAQKKATEMEARLREQAIKTAVIAEAAKLNIIDPEAAYALVDKTALNYSERGVDGLDDAMKALVEAKPYLVRKPQTVKPNPTNPGASGQQGETLEQKKQRIFGNKSADMFDPAQAAQFGGGVRFKDK